MDTGGRDLIESGVRGLSALGERYGAPTKTLRTKDGLRNLDLAVRLDERSSPKLWLSDLEHGPDGWLFWADRPVEPVEVKSALEGNGFQLYAARAETPDLLRRLSASALVFVVVGRESGRVEEAYYVPPGSPLHWELEERFAWLERGSAPRSKSMSIGRVRDGLGAVRLA